MFPFKTSDSWVEEAEDKLCPWVTGLNGIQLPSTLWWAAFFVVVEREKSVDVSDWRYCLFVDARPRAPITRHPCCVISIKLWPKESPLYRKNDTFFFLLPLLLANTPEKFCDAGKKSDKYHLLLMSLRTFGASLASAALRHCITIRWLSVGSATDGILLKTDFAFELAHVPRQKSSTTRLRRCDRLHKCIYIRWATWINFFWGG